jgi:hypothetical protein
VWRCRDHTKIALSHKKVPNSRNELVFSLTTQFKDPSDVIACALQTALEAA